MAVFVAGRTGPRYRQKLIRFFFFGELGKLHRRREAVPPYVARVEAKESIEFYGAMARSHNGQNDMLSWMG